MLPKGKHSIFITSAVPGEGKTTMALALARQMAMTGSSTLLIDADLRRPSLQKYLGEDVAPGLFEFLAGGATTNPEQISITREPSTGVSFVLGSRGSAVATDALLMSARFEQLMRYARENYDLVIVDTPPIGLVVDATIVARYCDLGIFVVRYASTNQQTVRAGLRDLKRVDVPICGVLNQVARSEIYPFGHYRKYLQYHEARVG
jgi:capsular exopolysaccharide synthesis family protein